MSAQKFDRLYCDVTKCGSGWNFYDYYVPRMNDIPEISVIVVPTNNHPTGVGQMATPAGCPRDRQCGRGADRRAPAAHPMTSDRVCAAQGT